MKKAYNQNRPSKTFEGTIEIKEYKNDNGNNTSFTIDTESENEARQKLKVNFDKYIADNNFYSWKYTDFNEKKGFE